MMVLDIPSSSPASVPIHQVLAAKNEITAHLEDAAEFERPGYFTGCCEEPEHLHDIARDPTCDDRDTEPFA